MNCSGCYASDGLAGFIEFPPSPWHAAHTAALFRPASASAAAAGAARNKNAAVAAAAFTAPNVTSGS